MIFIGLKQILSDRYQFLEFYKLMVDSMYFMDYNRVDELEYIFIVKDIDDEENI